MPIWRTGLAATAVLLAGAATLAATADSTSAAPVAPPANQGIAKLHTIVDLPHGVWTNTPLEVTLPRRGTYELDADVRGRLAGTSPLNTYLSARLWNVTAGAEVPESERLVYQIINLSPGSARAGGNQTAPISELISVTGPTRIRLQAQDNNDVGAATIAQVYSDGAGRTSLRYVRVGR
jgi:hypothetical protein